MAIDAHDDGAAVLGTLQPSALCCAAQSNRFVCDAFTAHSPTMAEQSCAVHGTG